MDLQEIYKEESGYDVGIYNIDNTNYYSEDYVEWLEKKLLIGSVNHRRELLITFLNHIQVEEIVTVPDRIEPIVDEYLKASNCS